MSRSALGWAMVLWCTAMAGCGEDAADRAQRRRGEQMVAGYTEAHTSCARGLAGAAGYTESVRTEGGVPLTVVTPANYDPGRGHPLLLVFAPAGISRFEVERVTAFSAPGTGAGFIVAYAEHPPLGLETTRDLSTAVRVLSRRWCIDEKRVFLAGHSDGGTVSHVIAAMPETRAMVRGIAPSGAGIRASDLEAFGCPAPRPVMISHGRNDKLFPGWGEETARWWAACNRCSNERRPLADGCVEFQGCSTQGPTRYCTTEGSHARWPANADRVVRFFQQAP